MTDDLVSMSQSPADVEFGFACPVCETRLKALESQVGQRIACPDCFERVEVPGEREREQRLRSKDIIAVPEQTWQQITALDRNA